MFSLSFRQKLVLSMMLVVSGVTLALLWISERKLQAGYEASFRNEFNKEVALLAAEQEARLGTLKANALAFGTSVRFVSLLNELKPDPKTGQKDTETIELFYSTLFNQLGLSGGAGSAIEPAFYRAYDQKGEMIPLAKPDELARRIDPYLKKLTAIVTSSHGQEVGYLKLPLADGGMGLHEIITAKFIDSAEQRALGTLVIGVPMRPEVAPKDFITALWTEGEIFGRAFEEPALGKALEQLAAAAASRREEGIFEASLHGTVHSILYRAINLESKFPPAYRLSAHSRAPLLAQQRELRWNIAGLGLLGLCGALLLSLILAHGLTNPINQLVAATNEIERGNYAVKVPVRAADEVGRLTESFNEMAAGLLLKEKYRSVLDMVADKNIAEDLMTGKIELGGEERTVGVLFCDIRGFTSLTEKMEPQQVIRMLNDHFTPLTRIVYEHHGAVDKFVGDLIMGIFGAPKSFGNDVENAARCALRMIEERSRLNESSEYRISIGIGVASGKVVAGRMGSTDRLNYTVLGPRVNLASRLCGQAGPMEVIIDDETWNTVRAFAVAAPTPELKLKGFASPVQAYKLAALRDHNEKPSVHT
jgi:class 3 adenylate cyclase